MSQHRARDMNPLCASLQEKFQAEEPALAGGGQREALVLNPHLSCISVPLVAGRAGSRILVVLADLGRDHGRGGAVVVRFTVAGGTPGHGDPLGCAWAPA